MAAALDAETTPLYQITARAKDGGTPSLSTTAMIQITVLPNNDHTPVFSEASSTQTIPENTPIGTTLYNANATDADVSTHGDLRYDIIDGDAANKFVIDRLTGVITIGSFLDFDTVPSYTLNISVTDNSGNTPGALLNFMQLQVQLSDINDITPQFTTSAYRYS